MAKKDNNANIHEEYLRRWLIFRGYAVDAANKAIAGLTRAARREGVKLYEANVAVYEMLRYGIPVSLPPRVRPL